MARWSEPPPSVEGAELPSVHLLDELPLAIVLQLVDYPVVIPVDLFKQDHMIRHGGLELCALLVVVDGNLVLHICVLRVPYSVGLSPSVVTILP